MKAMTLRLLSAAMLAGVASGAFAGIASTKHNLGSTQAISGANKTNDTGEICVFCHTPHGAATTAGAPLWNKNLNNMTGGTYTMYASSTMDSQQANDTTSGIGSTSAACLSCHDGTQAMDNQLNVSGSGIGTAGAAGGTAGWTFTGSNLNVNKINGGITLIGTDLSNDHPVGIAYCGWSSKAGVATPTGDIASGSCGDPDFNTATKITINAENFWYLNRNTTAGRQKDDIILYNRQFAGDTAAVTGPSVECASCHDPHRSDTNTFLRVNNTGSAVCVACHAK